jgi:pimeloyl-ACP methyl ester carboxylesterase
MTDPKTMVLVHGGGCGKECWDLLLPHLRSDVVTLDLPGRGDRPADLMTVGIADFVDAVVEEIQARDLRDVVLVGHSLAGVTIPQVAGAIPDRIRALVFVSCTVPADGQNVYDTLDPEIQAISDASPPGALVPMSADVQRAVLFNDLDDPALVEWGITLAVPEAPATITDRMVLSTMPGDIRRVWVKLLQDVIVAPEKQDRFVANLGGCELVELDCGHMAMLSRPADLAAILDAI